MENKLSCDQIFALLGFYAENKLNPKIKALVDKHLKTCNSCRELYKSAGVIFEESVYNPLASGVFHDDLSAYVDNELPDKDSIRIRKLVITNPAARGDLESMFTLKNEIKNSFLKIRNDCKTDYSKRVLELMSGQTRQFSFNKLVWTFTAMMSVIVAGFIVMLYF